jgi:hypothetical protein
MNRRPYRPVQSLHERLSDEFHRNGHNDKLHKADRGRFAPQGPMDSRSGDGQRRRAREMASHAADEMVDKSAKWTDQATRKRRLIEGPGEFREVRQDRTTKTIE